MGDYHIKGLGNSFTLEITLNHPAQIVEFHTTNDSCDIDFNKEEASLLRDCLDQILQDWGN